MITFEIRSQEFSFHQWKNTDNKLHRLNGPACTGWHENGKKSFEEYLVNGRFYRVGKPAFISWHTDGRRCREDHHHEIKEA